MKRLILLALISASMMLAADRIYVLTSFQGTRITTYTPSGKQIEPTILLGNLAPTGLALDSAGRIFVSSTAPIEQVLVFAPDGKRLGPYQPTGIPFAGGFGGTLGVSVEPSGNVHLLGRGPSGKGVVRSFMASGREIPPILFTGLDNPHGIATDSSGRLYVVSRGYECVNVYGTDRKLITSIKTGSLPGGVTVGADGTIYTVNHYAVSRHRLDGTEVGPRIFHKTEDGIDLPISVALDSSGKIYIGYLQSGLEGGKSCVAIFNPDGTPTGQEIKTTMMIGAIAVR